MCLSAESLEGWEEPSYHFSNALSRLRYQSFPKFLELGMERCDGEGFPYPELVSLHQPLRWVQPGATDGFQWPSLRKENSPGITREQETKRGYGRERVVRG